MVLRKPPNLARQISGNCGWMDDVVGSASACIDGYRRSDDVATARAAAAAAAAAASDVGL